MDESYEVVPLPARITGLVGDRLTVPTHVTPAGGQTTHPSVLFFPDGWNGFEYWMAHTPYPGATTTTRTRTSWRATTGSRGWCRRA